jgi:hypothetical protein
MASIAANPAVFTSAALETGGGRAGVVVNACAMIFLKRQLNPSGVGFIKYFTSLFFG